MNMGWRPMLTLLAAVTAAGCSSIGPSTIKRDRTDYSGAIASSWKEQMALNIVKNRYFDPPVFLDVSSVVSSQELQTRANVNSRFFPHPVSTAQDFYELGASGSYTDRPTISYTPLTTERYINRMLRPIPPQTIFAGIEAGYDAGFIFQLTVQAINGIYNSSFSLAHTRVGDPRFRQVTDAIRRLQQAGAINLRTERRREHAAGRQTDGQQAGRTGRRTGSEQAGGGGGHTDENGSAGAAWVVFRRNAGVAAEQDIRLIKSMLGLEARQDEFLIVYGLTRKPSEIALLTHSMQGILSELAAGVDVPEADVAHGSATPPVQPNTDAGPSASPLMRINSSSEPPIGAYTAVSYRNHWFWIDDGDLRSKAVFMFLMILSELSETRTMPQMPLITIPTSR